MDTMLMNILVPLGVCVALPVLIVWLVARVRKNETDRKAEIMLKAIENGQSIDPEFFKPSKKNVSVKKELLDKLNGACITGLMGIAFLLIFFFGREWADKFLPTHLLLIGGGVLLAVGIGLFVSYFAGKKMLAKEIEVEEKKLLEKEN